MNSLVYFFHISKQREGFYLLFFIVILFISSGCSVKNLYVHYRTMETKIDTISVQVYSDSTHRDTVRSEKKFYSYQKAPKMLHGSWYVFVGLAIAVVAVLVLKR